jgi:hypothetical protein
MIGWFKKELQELQELQPSPLVALHLYSTRNSSTSSLNIVASRSSSTSLPHPDPEKVPMPHAKVSPPATSQTSADFDQEKHLARTEDSSRRALSIKSGRPDIANIITSLVETADKNDRIAVASCGPDSLTSVTRETVAAFIKPDVPSLHVHCEQFGF